MWAYVAGAEGVGHWWLRRRVIGQSWHVAVRVSSGFALHIGIFDKKFT